MNSKDREALCSLAVLVNSGSDCTIAEISLGWVAITKRVDGLSLRLVIDPPGLYEIACRAGKDVKVIWPSDTDLDAGLKILSLHIDETIATMRGDERTLSISLSGVVAK